MENNKKILFSVTKKDLDITYFSGSGAGGQHRNKHQNCVRIYHKDSGVRVNGQNHKERRQNIKEALQSLADHPLFKLWVNRKVAEIDEGETIEKTVDKMMAPENIKVEILRDEKWIPWEDE